jgi:hypothetical protein
MTARREISLEYISCEPAATHASTDLAAFHIPIGSREPVACCKQPQPAHTVEAPHRRLQGDIALKLMQMR